MSHKLLATETLCVWTGYVLSSQRSRWYISKWAMSIEFTKEATHTSCLTLFEWDVIENQ